MSKQNSAGNFNSMFFQICKMLAQQLVLSIQLSLRFFCELLLQICQNLFMRGLSLVGWYHSHPRGPALPSLQDIDSQMDHQLRLQGSNNGFQPCLGIICGEYLPLHTLWDYIDLTCTEKFSLNTSSTGGYENS